MADIAMNDQGGRAAKPLSPTLYAGNIRDASRQLLLAAFSATTEPQREGAIAALLGDLKHALDDTFVTLHLNATHSQLRSVIALYVCGERPSPELLAQALQTHDEATRSTGSSALSTSTFVSFVTLALDLHYARAGASPDEEDDENEEYEEGDFSLVDPLKVWTGLEGGAKLNAKTAAYIAHSLPKVPKLGQGGEVEAEWEALLGVEATRTRVREAWSRAAGDVDQGHLVWDRYLNFELAQLKTNKTPETIEGVKTLFLARLRQAHRTLNKTFERYSRFVSTYLSAQEYESAMTGAAALLAEPRKAWSQIERHEDALRSAGPSSWKTYLREALSQKPPHAHVDATSALFERALAQRGLPPVMAAEHEPPTPEWDAKRKGEKRAMSKEAHAAKAAAAEQERLSRWNEAEGLWLDYIWFMSAPKMPAALLFDVSARAARALPGSGSVWAAYMRVFARQRRSKESIEGLLNAALAGQQIKETPQIVNLYMGRIDAGRELAAVALVENGVAPDEALLTVARELEGFMEIYTLITTALHAVPAASPDPELRLEILYGRWAEAGGFATIAFGEEKWEEVVKAQPTNVLAFREAAGYYARAGLPKKARLLYKQAASRSSITASKDELVREWLAFERVHGTPQDVDFALAKQRELQEQAWAAYYKAYAEQQQQQQHYAAATMDVQMEDASNVVAEGSSSSNQKRKADDDAAPPSRQTREDSVGDVSFKKGKAPATGKPQRDRENASVLVANLSLEATELDLRKLFRDCGEIAEIVGPKTLEGDAASAAAIVEFTDRSAIPAARTRDKKRVRGEEVRVSLGRECTLYVTNFPERFTYDSLRELFAPFGPVYDIRLPSRKFATSRRFCYVQYTVPESAQAALALHGRELEAGHALQVLLSDPSRRQARTDENASEREIYVSGLPRAAQADDLKALFEALGDVEGFRFLTHPDGKAKGIAFVDMRTSLDAQRAVAELNGTKVSGKAINVSLASSKGRPNLNAQGAATRYTPEERAAAIKARGLPHDAQEPRIQMIFEQASGGGFGAVRKVDWTAGSEGHGIATIIFADAALAGKALLVPEIKYDDVVLSVAPLSGGTGNVGGSTSAAATAFTPRAARGGAMARGGRGRGRGGIGFARAAPPPAASTSGAMDVDDAPPAAPATPAADAQPKTQDAFRDMLRKG